MATTEPRPMSAEEKKVIFASSLGTVFEWYDFYLYGSLAAIIAKQFFSGFFRLPRVEGPPIFPDCGSMVELSEQATPKL
jgi:hypothetical protein